MPHEHLTAPIKHCLECGEPLGAGRDDRKFCHDPCRVAYNNRRRKEQTEGVPFILKEENSAFRTVFDVLMNNREILMMHYLYKGEHAELRDLLGKGLNLKFFTSEYKSPEAGIYKFSFDFGYCLLADGWIHIMERRDEIFLPHH